MLSLYSDVIGPSSVLLVVVMVDGGGIFFLMWFSPLKANEQRRTEERKYHALGGKIQTTPHAILFQELDRRSFPFLLPPATNHYFCVAQKKESLGQKAE